MSEHLHMAMTVDKFALLVIFCNGSFFLNCCHVEKMTHVYDATFPAVNYLMGFNSVINSGCDCIRKTN